MAPMGPSGAAGASGATDDGQPDDQGGAGSSGPGDRSGGTPQDVVKATVALVSKATRNLEEAGSIAAQINTQFPGSQKQAQILGQLIGQAQKQFASLMADLVKTTSRQTDASSGPSMFGG
jgi:hypothetical protein